jgi:hypothetical protein
MHSRPPVEHAGHSTETRLFTMLAAPAPHLSTRKPPSPPTSREKQATWATIFLLLVAFWYGVGVAVGAAWSWFVG